MKSGNVLEFPLSRISLNTSIVQLTRKSITVYIYFIDRPLKTRWSSGYGVGTPILRRVGWRWFKSWPGLLIYKWYCGIFIGLSPFHWHRFPCLSRVAIIEPSTLWLNFVNLCFTTTAVCSETVCCKANVSMLGTFDWVIFCKKKLHRFPLLFFMHKKRDNSYCVCLCFLMMTYSTCFWK